MADKITKIDAAARQIETAIELYFNNGDSLSTYTLGYAAFKVLFDLYPHRINDGFAARLDDLIKKEGWQSLSRTANFLKHADRDPEAVLTDHHPEMPVAVIGLAVVFYGRIAGDLTKKMMAFDSWIEWLGEEALGIPEVDENSERAAAVCAYAAHVAKLPHDEKIVVGRAMYETFLNNVDAIRLELDEARKQGRSITEVLDRKYRS